MSNGKMKIFDEMGKNEFVKFFVKFFTWNLIQKGHTFALYSYTFKNLLT